MGMLLSFQSEPPMTLDINVAGAIHSLNSLSHNSFSPLLTPWLGLIATFVVILVAQYVRSPWRRVPPGPKGLPIIGNALQLQNKGWMFESVCKQKFGSSNPVFFADSNSSDLLIQPSEHIMYLNALGQPIIVLHSLKAAFELLDRRANIYSGRPRFVVAQDIFCGGLFAALMSYGDVLV
jgi:hypothetical protein